MIVVAAAAAAVSAWLVVRPGHRRPVSTRALSPRTAVRLACACAGVVTALLVGGVVGIGVGAAVVLLGPRLLARLESGAQRRRREALERQAPAAADLLAACISAGATPADAARAVAEALGEPIAASLQRLTGALDLGAAPASAWAALAADTPLRPIARAAARSAETGAPLAALLAAVADDQRDEARARAEATARAAGVRSVAPLAACFLPAFLLLGIVPVVASLALPLLQ